MIERVFDMVMVVVFFAVNLVFFEYIARDADAMRLFGWIKISGVVLLFVSAAGIYGLSVFRSRRGRALSEGSHVRFVDPSTRAGAAHQVQVDAQIPGQFAGNRCHRHRPLTWRSGRRRHGLGRRTDHCEGGPNWNRLALRHQDAQQHAGRRRRDGLRRLCGFDFHEVIVRLDGIAFAF
jgi:hypothetical protein